jgi:hypothetical protein
MFAIPTVCQNYDRSVVYGGRIENIRKLLRMYVKIEKFQVYGGGKNEKIENCLRSQSDVFFSNFL